MAAGIPVLLDTCSITKTDSPFKTFSTALTIFRAHCSYTDFFKYQPGIKCLSIRGLFVIKNCF